MVRITLILNSIFNHLDSWNFWTFNLVRLWDEWISTSSNNSFILWHSLVDHLRWQFKYRLSSKCSCKSNLIRTNVISTNLLRSLDWTQDLDKKCFKLTKRLRSRIFKSLDKTKQHFWLNTNLNYCMKFNLVLGKRQKK